MAPKNVINLTRTDAAKLIEEIRKCLARRSQEQTKSGARDITLRALERLFEDANIPALTPCPWEHDATVDNCGGCAPRWMLLGDFVKVR